MQIASEMRGSTRRQPKKVISRAPTITPRENRASWSEWSQALFMLKFRAEIFCSSSVAAPFPTKATTATQSISLPGISGGAVNLLRVSQKTKAMTTDRTMLLTKAAINSILR